MRPLYHPPAEEMTGQGILYALSEPARVRIFIELLDAKCAKNCSTFLTINKKPLPKSTLSQHFTILREAGLIRSVRKGVELQNETRCADFQQKFGRMIKEIIEAYLAEAKSRAGSRRSH
jgi:DNA-binding transcriptional ArsR family regulator